MPIRPLPQSLINKIAAGEVIERPASVVKELVENALDAGATRVDVSLEAGGVDLVRVVDNGCGIAAHELPLAVASHATSKIVTADDLFRIATLGFRGEALASIAEVSQLRIRSRTAQSEAGAELEVHGGVPAPVTPCGCPPGTMVEVRHLFYNTPVRRKFMRSAQTELGHVSEALVRLALAWPNVHFTLQHQGRPVFDLPGDDGLAARIARLYGRDLAEHLIAVESCDGPVRLSGYVAHPSQTRSNNRMQFLFLNRRPIRDRALQHALAEAYRGLLMAGRFPIAFLVLEMPAEWVDVNVHPTKLEVRFQDSSRLYSQLLAALRGTFLSTDLTTRIAPAAEHDPTDAHAENRATEVRRQVVAWAKGLIATWPQAHGAPAGGPAPEAPPMSAPAVSGQPLELVRLERAWEAAPGGDTEETPAEPPGLIPERADPAPGSGIRPKAMQVHDRYLIAEREDGLIVIDQHALHERILYEELRARIARGPMESQTLLVPEPVDLSALEAAAALEHRQLLAELGIRIEPFGGDTVLVVGFPSMLANLHPAEVLRGLLEVLVSTGKAPERRDLLDKLLHGIACKAAVKAGDRLSPEEIAALLAQSHLIDDAHHCPHGRPAALLFTREELDKRFGRT